MSNHINTDTYRMKKIGLFYGTSTAKTAEVARKIEHAFADTEIETVSIESAGKMDFEKYDCLVVGTSTWFDGELPYYWDEIVPDLEALDLTGKQIAIFGLGNQQKYPENFVDGIGLLAEAFLSCGATLVGLTSSDGYQFLHSRALKGHQLQGLAIDLETQPELTDTRIQAWVNQLKKEFEH